MRPIHPPPRVATSQSSPQGSYGFDELSQLDGELVKLSLRHVVVALRALRDELSLAPLPAHI